MANADGIPVWLIEGRDIPNRRRIEDGDIRDQPWPENRSVQQMDSCRRFRCHLSDRFFQRQQMLIADVVAQYAWKRTPRARVRLVLGQAPVFGLGGRIGPDAD